MQRAGKETQIDINCYSSFKADLWPWQLKCEPAQYVLDALGVCRAFFAARTFQDTDLGAALDVSRSFDFDANQ